MPNKEWVLEAGAPAYEVEMLRTGWVQVTEIASGRGLAFPPHQIEQVIINRTLAEDKEPEPTAVFSSPAEIVIPTPDIQKRPRGRPPKAR